jgi:hypothetical protein
MTIKKIEIDGMMKVIYTVEWHTSNLGGITTSRLLVLVV